MTEASPRPDLITLFADVKAEADTLERNEAAFSVPRVRAIVKDLERASETFTKFIDEGKAQIRSGRGRDWVRQKLYMQLEPEGHAYQKGGVKYFRECMVPRRANVLAAENEGRAAAIAERERRKASGGDRSRRKAG